MAENLTSGYNNSANENNSYDNSGYDKYGYDTSINNTSEYNSDINPYKFVFLTGETAFYIIHWILFAITLVATIYGVTSWCFIKKFRHFRNYVFLSANLANLLRFIVFHIFIALLAEELIQHLIVRVLPFALYIFFSLSFHCWLLVLCYIFYVDFVKVFRLDIHRRFLKSSLFAWGVPFIIVTSYFLIGWLVFLYDLTEIVTIPFSTFLLLIPVMFSFGLYVAVLYSLFFGTAAASTSSSKWRRFYIATLIFVLSNIIVLTALLELLQVKNLTIDVIGELGEYLNSIALAMYIMIVKSNRVTWGEFLNNRFNRNSLEMR